MLPRLALTFALAVLAFPSALLAQSPPPDPETAAPAHVAHVEGAASLEREGRAENSPLNMPLLSGDRLRTGEGRLEVLFADGSTLHLDNRSTVDVQSDELMRLTEGRLRLNIPGGFDTARDRRLTDGLVSYRIDSPAGSARITQPGEYRIALLRGDHEIQLEVAVVRGGAEVFTDLGATPVRAGERAYASAGLAPSLAYAYNSANWDAFDRWSEGRRDVRLGVSSRYLPADMQAYAPLLDESGDWRYTQDYGYAWYPRVAAEWRPYYYGRWASYPGFGWTWIGAERFAWPTHHYGRWGLSAGVWFWIPSSRWAPAYVSWAYAPGYVSWCPLGFNNRPIISIDLYRAGPGYYSPWRAWTAVSYSHFGGRDFYVNQRAVNWDRIDRTRHPRFEPRASAPGSLRDVAVPRNATPIRWAGRADAGAAWRAGNGPASRATGSDARRVDDAGQDRSINRGLPGVTGRPNPPARDTSAPRYVNRGDEIVRSPSARPMPRAASPGTLSPNRDLPRAETRTMPAGPARPAQPSAAAGNPTPDPGYQRRSDPRGYQPSPTRGPESPVYSPAQPRAYEPRGYQPQPRGYERARPANEPPAAAPPPARAPAPDRAIEGPRAYERPPAAPRQPERAAPSERAAPAERTAPAERAAPARSAPGERAAPRAGTVAPRGRGGR